GLFHFAQQARRQIGPDEHYPLVALRQRMHHVEAAFTHDQSSSGSPMARRTSSDNSALWCQDALFSAAGIPLPLIVWQMTTRGRWAGRFMARAKGRRRSATSWPFASSTWNPKLAHLSASGSMFWISNTLPADWNLL